MPPEQPEPEVVESTVPAAETETAVDVFPKEENQSLDQLFDHLAERIESDVADENNRTRALRKLKTVQEICQE